MSEVASSGSVLSLRSGNGYLAFNARECEAVGRHHHHRYVGNQPFAHVVLDDFLEQPILTRVLKEFPCRERGRFADSYSRLKTGYRLEQIRSAHVHDLLGALNSWAFLRFLEELTGIDGLICDPHYAGGGLHETARGGHLSIHADFNVHAKLKLVRRLNLIVFLNASWDPGWGGALELWDKGMNQCQVRIEPLLGRAVIFNTDITSYHGHPEPLACPEHVFRRSLALYYYTAPESARMVRHSTLFQPRPGTADRPLSWKEQARNWGYRLAASGRRSRPHRDQVGSGIEDHCEP